SVQRWRTNLLLGMNSSIEREDWRKLGLPVLSTSVVGLAGSPLARGPLLAASALIPPKPRRYNSAVLIDANGKTRGRYDKIHRVPFGEYVPLRDWLPWMNAFAPYDFDYSVSAGERFTRLESGPYLFGVQICYEDTDPSLARHYAVREGEDEPVDF